MPQGQVAGWSDIRFHEVLRGDIGLADSGILNVVTSEDRAAKDAAVAY